VVAFERHYRESCPALLMMRAGEPIHSACGPALPSIVTWRIIKTSAVLDFHSA